MFGIKRTKADALFSDYIRLRDDYTCQRCFKQYEGKQKGIQCSHFHGRGKRSVRFDPENALALCAGCHSRFTAYPDEHVEWFKRRIGPVKYELLSNRANIPQKVDEKLIEIWLKNEIELLKQRNWGVRKV